MTRYTPLWQQAGSYTALMDRALIAALYPAGGSTGAGVAVVANTMNLSIAPGRIMVPLASGAGCALCAWDAAEVVTSPASPPAGNTRIDIIVCQVRDPQLDAGVNNDFIFQVIAGTPSTGTPAYPATPANAALICTYTVPAAAANLNGVAINDWRSQTPGVIPSFASAAVRDALWIGPPIGALCLTLDTGTMWQRLGNSTWANLRPMIWAGSNTPTTDGFGNFGVNLPPSSKSIGGVCVGAQSTFPFIMILNSTDMAIGASSVLFRAFAIPSGNTPANSTIAVSWSIAYTY